MPKKKGPPLARERVKPPKTLSAPPAMNHWRRPATRVGTSPLAGHYPEEQSRAFRALAASQGKDVQELLAEAINMAFQRYKLPNRIEVTSGRRARREA